MPTHPRPPAVVPVVFDELAIAEDLRHLTPTAATALTALRARLDRAGGIALEELRRCDPEGRDGTRLPACVKTYVPWPAGRWGLVFDTARRPGRPTELYALAYGHRHPDGRQLSVYQVAHRRLHGR